MRSYCAIIAVLAVLAAGAPARAERPAAPDPVAVINGQPVPRADYAAYLVRALGPYAMESFVDWALVEQEARRRGVAVTPEELAARRRLEEEMRRRAVPEQARMEAEEFRLAAQSQGLDADALYASALGHISDDALRAHLLAEKLLEPGMDLGDEALRAHYERTRGRRFVAAHVVVRTQREAERVLARLREEPELWAEAVRKFSLDRVSVPYKGRIGPVPAESPLGRVLAGMAPDEMRACPLGQSWQVLRLVREVPATGEDFETLREQLRVELIALKARSRYEGLLADLHSRAAVVVNLSGDERTRGLMGRDAAAFVNGEPIPLSYVGDVLVTEFGRGMLRPYVERVIVFQEARQRGVSVSPEAEQARMRAVAEDLYGEYAVRRGVTPEQLDRALETGGADSDALRRELMERAVQPEDVRATLLAEQMVASGVEVSEADVQAAYAELGQECVIVKELSADDAAAADRLTRRLEEGVSFDAAALTATAEPGAWLAGGLISIIGPAHPYYPYVKDLQPGEVSGVFKHDGKYRIIKVLKRRAAQQAPPLEQVRPLLEEQIRLRLTRPRIRALLVKLQAEADIQIKIE